jgi:hypothetical protein
MWPDALHPPVLGVHLHDKGRSGEATEAALDMDAHRTG